MTCHLCATEAIAVFRFSHGCQCDPTEIQPLCPQHAFKASPADGGTMELIEDLSCDGDFGRYWAGQGRWDMKS